MAHTSTTRLMLALALAAGSGCNKQGSPSPPGWRFDSIGFEDYPPNVTELLALGDYLLVGDKSGEVSAYDWEGDLKGRFTLPAFDMEDCGLMSLAVEPDFAETGLLWYGACFSVTRSGVFRVHLDTSTWTTSDHVEILTAEDPEATNPWHNVGWIGFDASGALIALFGEKTNAGNSQDSTTLLGKTVRIIPSRVTGSGGYTVPADNPFPEAVGGEILALGFRSPWTGGVDTRGRLWVADVGASGTSHEEVNLVTSGSNYGWPLQVGPCTDLPRNCDDFTDPIVSWPHGTSHVYYNEDPDSSLTLSRVGWLAPGPSGDDPYYGGLLRDRILFGDTCVGFVRSLQVDAEGALVSDEFIGHLDGVAAWAQAPDGSMLVSTLASCISDRTDGSAIYRLGYTAP